MKRKGFLLMHRDKHPWKFHALWAVLFIALLIALAIVSTRLG